MLRLIRRENFFLAILALTAFLRLYRLDAIPPDFHFDQAYYTLDVLQILSGHFGIFFENPGGSEPLFIYLALAPVLLSGADSALALKIVSALIGIATVALMYPIARGILRSPRAGIFAALFTAMISWHLFYSRNGERNILTVLFVMLALYFYWRAITHNAPRHLDQPSAINRHQLNLAGVFTGIALYTYPAARILPILLVALTLLFAFSERTRAREYWLGLARAFGIALIVFLPLGIFYLQFPRYFIEHTAQVSLFATHTNAADLLAAIGDNARKVAAMFLFSGDPGAIRNVPFRPVFDPFIGVFFVLGLAISLSHAFLSRSIEQKRAQFILLWMLAWLSASLLSDDAPNYARTIPALPAVVMLAAWGANEIYARLSSLFIPTAPRVSLYATRALFAIILFAATALMFRDYFGNFANDAGTYYAYNGDKVEIAAWIKARAANERLYLSEIVAKNSTVALLTRRAVLKSFDSRDTIILPANSRGGDARFVFPAEQEKRWLTMAERLGALATSEIVRGKHNEILLYTLRVAASDLPDANNSLTTLARGGAFLKIQNAERVNWMNEIEMLGYRLDPEGPGGRNLVVTLFARANAKINADYTFSVKVRDAHERVWGQEDKWLGDNSYASSRWDIGEIIVEKFYPGLNACAPAGDYRVSVEMYDPQSNQVVMLVNGAGNIAPLGAFRAGASEGNRYEDLEPAQRAEIRVGDSLQLFGYTLTPTPLRAGDAFALSLFWRGDPNARAAPVRIQLRDATAREFALADATLAVPRDARGLCTLFDLRAPRETASGAGVLLVNNIEIARIVIK